MRLYDLKIGAQLRLGFGIILLFVAVLGITAKIQTHQLWLQTAKLYDHPMTVGRAISTMETDIESIARHAKELFLCKNEQEVMAVLQGMELSRADAELQFTVVKARYLGPRSDLNSLHEELVKWDSLRDETLRLFRTGKMSEAEARVAPGGIQSGQAEAVRNAVLKIDTFAINKAAEFYQTAAKKNDTFARQLYIIISVILLLSATVIWLLLKGIKAPLKELTGITEQFRKGNLDVRSRYVSANELGTLSASFNAMAEAIQNQIKTDADAARLADVMLREDEIHKFCREILKTLIQQTGSQIGAIYFLNETKTYFEHFDSIGLGSSGHESFSATELEGELGTVLATRQIQRITDIPANTHFAFAAVSGDLIPREILTIPVLSDRSVSAVISLASVHAYSEQSIKLINDIWGMLTARINGVLAFRKVKDLAEQLDHQNRELDAQKQELTLQASEVAEQNTELEMQKQQLEEANRLKSAFLSNMSHELRTPLNSVIALAGVLHRRLANTVPPEEYSYLEIIERNGRSLLELINNILDLSRVEAGREDLNISRFPIRELAEEVAGMLGPLAAEKKIALRNEVPADLPHISSDPAKCRHILQNLVANAIKFTETGSIEISARQKDRNFYISVRDTGIGIAADHIKHIFDEFRQADGSTSRKYGGTGLGLAIAKKYAELLGGSISVESVPGKGSTFTIQLPRTMSGIIHAPKYEAPSAAAPAATEVPASRGQHILLVEDNEPAIIQLTDILQAAGYQIQVAHDGKQALEQIEKQLPDAMILDLMMPEVDGFQVLHAIRSTKRTDQLPVLILTAKHITKEELSFLKGNHIYQLIQKGDVNRAGLLAAVAQMVTRPVETKPAAPAPRRTTRRAGKPVVLVVEDHPDNLRTARALLEDQYEVIEAQDGRSGIDQARKHKPDVILMDIALPVMDGIQALQEIRKDDSLRRIPVIAATASAMKGERETILAHGFDAYVSKPIDAELLKKTLTEALD